MDTSTAMVVIETLERLLKEHQHEAARMRQENRMLWDIVRGAGYEPKPIPRSTVTVTH